MQCADDSEIVVDVQNDEWDDNWDGCFNRNSYIVRCPFPYIPCEEMWSYKDSEGKTIDRNDFKCGKNCEDKGGKRKTGNGGNEYLNMCVNDSLNSYCV